MRKKLAREIIIIAFAFIINMLFMTTCHAYTYWFTSQAEEQEAGDRYSYDIESQNKIIQGSTYNDVVNSVTYKLVNTIEYPRYQYKVKILDDGGFNAYSVPGGHIYVTYKLMQAVKTYDECAFVVGHELGHDMNEHYMQTIERMYRSEFGVAILASAFKVKTNVRGWLYAATYITVSRGYGFDKEHQADKFGFDHMTAAGYNPGAGAMFFWALKKMENPNASTDIGSEINNYLSPHPKTEVRLQKQLEYLKAWSGNVVEVKGTSIYINGKLILTPGKNGKYDSHERAYYLAGNIARKYHDEKVVSWWVNDEGRLMANNDVIYTPVGNDERSYIVASRLGI